MPSHWYESFFDGLAVEMWRTVPTDEMTRGEADFLEQELRLKPGDSVLDIPCGDGRHAAELASRGYRMTGFDISETFLQTARQRPVAVEWIQGDMVHPPNGGFDAAYCWGNSFGYLGHEDTVRFLSNLQAVLKSGARFVLDSGTIAEALFPTFAARSEYQVGGITVITERQFDSREGRMRNRYHFATAGRSEVKDLDQGVYTCAELVRMMRAAGFETDALYAGIDQAPFGLGARRLILVATCLPRPSTEQAAPSLP